MSVLIMGMKMPDCCLNCPCIDSEYGKCNISKKIIRSDKGRLADCPLIELPDHGDLIERNRLHHDLKADAIDKFALLDDTYLRYLEGLEKAEELLLGATVVIPAERSEDATN